MDRITWCLLLILIILLGLCGISHCQGHYKNCSKEEEFRKNCLNGGKCFVMELDDRQLGCNCPSTYIGSRCQYMDILIAGSSLRVEKAIFYVIVIGAVVGGIIIGAVVVSLICRRHTRRQERMYGKANHNENVTVYSEVPDGNTENA